MEPQEINRLFSSEEARLRSLWKADFQAAIRSERTILLDHAERIIKEEVEKARNAIDSEMREQLSKFGNRIAEQGSKNSREIVGLSENMEDRLREHIPVYIREIVKEVLAEKENKQS